MKTYERYTGDHVGNGHSREASEIERDVGQIRREMAQTIDAIESKLSPGEIVNQLIAQFRGGGGGTSEFARNLGDTVKANPVPVVLIATGLGALLLSGTEAGTALGSRVRRSGEHGLERVRERGQEMAERAREQGEGSATEGVKRSVSERAQRAKESAEERMHRAQDRMHGAQDRARDGVDRAREGARRAQVQGRQLIEEQPLVLVGLGLALGAAFAGRAPSSGEVRSFARQAKEKVQAKSDELLHGGESVSETRTEIDDGAVASAVPVEPTILEPEEPVIRPERGPGTI